MLTHNLGYPRIGSRRELKKACESYWSSRISAAELHAVAQDLRRQHWRLQQESGIDLIPCNDFSLYDQVLDHSFLFGAIPARFRPLLDRAENDGLDLYFAMARGHQNDGLDLIAMEMTKWFDTNYHYLVPEFTRNQSFSLNAQKLVNEYAEARRLGINAKPVLIGPVTYLLLGKEKEADFNRLDLLPALLPVYAEALQALAQLGAEYVQMDEPFLALDLSDAARPAYTLAYEAIARACPSLKIILASYFAGLDRNAALATSLPLHCLHLDLARAPAQLEQVLSLAPRKLSISLGLVNGRNVWKNDLQDSLALISRAVETLGEKRVALAPSCSLLHVPCDLELESDNTALPSEKKRWLAFARQKLEEVAVLRGLAQAGSGHDYTQHLKQNLLDLESYRQSTLVHRPTVKQRAAAVKPEELRRQPFATRQHRQQRALKLPLFPTTTIGSFPQTDGVRQLRLRLKKGDITEARYRAEIRAEIQRTIHWQEDIGLDVLVHGEFERNDMVEYFGELLEGFAITGNGWVQSYGSRCVKPPIIYGDVQRACPMTVAWSAYAQSLTQKLVKGMLTGPVTILQWSFVREDQPRSSTAMQIALAIRDEARDLEAAGIRIIQIDEPAIREGLPLRHADWNDYLRWAVDAFRLACSGVADETQIHTHMCYSEFNDIIESIADMDADVITIETARSQMKLLDAFTDFRYPNEIGPGVYDIHSPRVATEQEMLALLRQALVVLPARNLWVNPDCGLKTRKWAETDVALVNMVAAAKALRRQLA
ncbi:MAG: 5-methyltetrahydropteroyltriglutamate--homocysteine S-methyltransferase [Nevskiales bacterium]